MNCCENCFSDYYIKDFIQKNGIIEECDICKSQNIKCIDPSELYNLLQPLINLYTPIIDFMPMEIIKSYEGEYIWDKLTHDWEIFDDTEIAEKVLTLLFDDPKDPNIMISEYVEVEDEYFEFDRSGTSLNSMWDEFIQEIRFKNRFLPNKRIEPKDMSSLLSYLEVKVNADVTFYRARISEEKIKYSITQMGKPPPDVTKDGRANPFGIPCLYIASDENTAITEIRPSINDYVTVGSFLVKRGLNLIDLRQVSPLQFRKSDEFNKLVYNTAFLNKLGMELSKPVNLKDARFEYLPTQYLCEIIKSFKWNGVMYRSSLSEKKGYNLAIFDDANLECIETKLFKIKEVDVNYKYDDDV